MSEPTQGAEKGGALALREKASVASSAGETASSAVAARERAAIEAQYLVAMRNPRDWLDVEQRLLRECDRPGFAATAIYAKPQGNTKVTGPSIRFVEAALRCATNVAVSTTIVFEDREKRIMRVSVIDLEANISFDEEVVIEKTVERRKSEGREVIGERTNKQGEKVFIVASTDDELLTKQNNLRSKAIRNCGIRVIPGDIVESAKMRVTETKSKEDAKDPMAAVKRTAAAFYDLGVDAADLEKLLGVPLDRTTAAQRAFLGNIWTAIKEGESTWDEVMASMAAAESTTKGMEGLKARLTKKEAPKAGAVPPAKEEEKKPEEEGGKPPAEASAESTDAELTLEQQRMDILASLEGMTVSDLHKHIKAKAQERGVRNLGDLNSLTKKALVGMGDFTSYQEIQTAEQATAVLMMLYASTKAK